MDGVGGGRDLMRHSLDCVGDQCLQAAPQQPPPAAASVRTAHRAAVPVVLLYHALRGLVLRIKVRVVPARVVVRRAFPGVRPGIGVAAPLPPVDAPEPRAQLHVAEDRAQRGLVVVRLAAQARRVGLGGMVEATAA